MCAPKKQLLQIALIGATAYATGGGSLFASSAATSAATTGSTLQTLATVAKYALPIVGAAGNIYSGYMQAQMLNQKAGFTDFEIGMEKESYALRRAKRAREMNRMIGKQRALYGVSGVTISGTPGDILGQTRADYAEDEYIDSFNTSQSILGKTHQASIYKSEAKMAVISGYTKAAVTLGNRGLFNYGSVDVETPRKVLPRHRPSIYRGGIE